MSVVEKLKEMYDTISNDNEIQELPMLGCDECRFKGSDFYRDNERAGAFCRVKNCYTVIHRECEWSAPKEEAE